MSGRPALVRKLKPSAPAELPRHPLTAGRTRATSTMAVGIDDDRRRLSADDDMRKRVALPWGNVHGRLLVPNRQSAASSSSVLAFVTERISEHRAACGVSPLIVTMSGASPAGPLVGQLVTITIGLGAERELPRNNGMTITAFFGSKTASGTDNASDAPRVPGTATYMLTCARRAHRPRMDPFRLW